MSPRKRYAKKCVKARQRRRLHAQARLERDRRQAQRAAEALRDRKNKATFHTVETAPAAQPAPQHPPDQCKSHRYTLLQRLIAFGAQRWLRKAAVASAGALGALQVAGRYSRAWTTGQGVVEKAV